MGRAAEAVETAVREIVDMGCEDAPEGYGLAPALWPTRDTLLGRSARHDDPLWLRLVGGTARDGNPASVPGIWVTWESREQARALDRQERTEHILLALLATYEVGRLHPEVAGVGGVDPAARFDGGTRLARQGIDHATVLRALADRPDLGPDDKEAEHYLYVAEDEESTGALLDALLRGETRARRLLESLGHRGDARDKEEKEDDDDLDAGDVVEGTGTLVETLLQGGAHTARRVLRFLGDAIS
ncbi:hypothetical protein ABT354_32275 [Streptomyces sp. NPDC000594]|uniref:hypothetical protein n=1 Tax=Streptomyces sp. NPDC000594 TaxID=3154261 RepID=UPI00331DFF36